MAIYISEATWRSVGDDEEACESQAAWAIARHRRERRQKNKMDRAKRLKRLSGTNARDTQDTCMGLAAICNAVSTPLPPSTAYMVETASLRAHRAMWLYTYMTRHIHTYAYAYILHMAI